MPQRIVISRRNTTLFPRSEGKEGGAKKKKKFSNRPDERGGRRGRKKRRAVSSTIRIALAEADRLSPFVLPKGERNGQNVDQSASAMGGAEEKRRGHHRRPTRERSFITNTEKKKARLGKRATDIPHMHHTEEGKKGGGGNFRFEQGKTMQKEVGSQQSGEPTFSSSGEGKKREGFVHYYCELRRRAECLEALPSSKKKKNKRRRQHRSPTSSVGTGRGGVRAGGQKEKGETSSPKPAEKKKGHQSFCIDLAGKEKGRGPSLLLPPSRK